MKLMSIVWATVVLVLALKPSVELFSAKAQDGFSCCSSVCESTEEPAPSHDDGCEDKLCNPFQVCGACFFVASTSEAKLPVPPSPLAEHHFDYRADFSQLISADFWQPPKWV